MHSDATILQVLPSTESLLVLEVMNFDICRLLVSAACECTSHTGRFNHLYNTIHIYTHTLDSHMSSSGYVLAEQSNAFQRKIEPNVLLQLDKRGSTFTTYNGSPCASVHGRSQSHFHTLHKVTHSPRKLNRMRHCSQTNRTRRKTHIIIHNVQVSSI